MSDLHEPWTYREFGNAVHIRNARGQFIGSMLAHGKLVVALPEMLAREKVLVEALREAREWIAQDIACVIEAESLCGADGNPDRSTMPPEAAAEIVEHERFLARIDAALAGVTPDIHAAFRAETAAALADAEREPRS